jgi:hypothetical protein
MDDIDFEHFEPSELERLLAEASNPAVPVDVFYAVLDRVIASTTRQGTSQAAPEMLGAGDTPT